MAGVPLTVSAAQVLGAQHSIDAVVQDVRAGVAALVVRVDDLLGAQWSGAAATSYREPWERWVEGSTEVVEGLGSMAALLGLAAQAYAQQERINTGDLTGAVPTTSVLNL